VRKLARDLEPDASVRAGDERNAFVLPLRR
jgi:hypothetical protein